MTEYPFSNEVREVKNRIENTEYRSPNISFNHKHANFCVAVSQQK
jgi:hypothetical protein